MRYSVKPILIAVSLLIAVSAKAGVSCELMKVLDRAEIKNDPTFWTEFGKLSETGKLDDRHLLELFKKRSIEPRYTPANAPHEAIVEGGRRVGQPKYSVEKAALKDIAILPTQIRKSLEEFLAAATKGKEGLQELRANQGRWQLKHLNGSSSHSARLNRAYRVEFKYSDDGRIHIIGVNNHIGHGT